MNTKSLPSSGNLNEPEIHQTPATTGAADTPPPRRGRPSSLTPEIEAALFECLELGLNVIEACGVCGVSEKSFRNWRKRSPAFAARMKRAEYEAVKIHIANIRKAAERGQSWRASAWWLEHRHPMQWGRTQTLTVEDKRQAEYDASCEKMTPAQREAKIREILGMTFGLDIQPEGKVQPARQEPDAEDLETVAPRSPEPDSPSAPSGDENQAPPAPPAVKMTPSVFIGGPRNGQAAEFDPMDGKTCWQDEYALKKVTFNWGGRVRRLSVFADPDAENASMAGEAVRLFFAGNQPIAKALAAQESAELSGNTPVFTSVMNGNNYRN